MICIGIRATPQKIYFAIFDSAENQIINVSEVVIPKVFDTSEGLKFIRSQFLDIVQEYQVESAGIRLTESVARGTSKERIQIEAVLLEALSSSSIKEYYEGQIATIAANLGIERPEFKKYIDEEIDLKLIENWGNHSKEEKEAILTAIGCYND